MGMAVLVYLIFAICLGFIPAKIASDKGHSFGLWWFYGFCIFIVAFIHSLLLKDDVEEYKKQETERQQNAIKKEMANPEILLKYKNLLDENVISQDEFDKKKKELLGE